MGYQRPFTCPGCRLGVAQMLARTPCVPLYAMPPAHDSVDDHHGSPAVEQGEQAAVVLADLDDDAIAVLYEQVRAVARRFRGKGFHSDSLVTTDLAQETLLKAFGRMLEKRRSRAAEVLRLRAFFQMSLPEMADALDCSPAAAQRELAFGRVFLRRRGCHNRRRPCRDPLTIARRLREPAATAGHAPGRTRHASNR